MLYVILDLVGIVIASLLSQPLKHVLTTTQTSAMLDAATLCVGIIGIQGAITTKQPLLMLVSLVFGTLVGYWLDIDGRFTGVGHVLERRLHAANEDFVAGFVAALMIECIGSMAIIGPLNEALSHNPDIMLMKIVLDVLASLIYGAAFGPGVLFAGPFVFAYEAVIYCAAAALHPFLTTAVITEIGAVGSVLLVALAIDVLKIRKLKVANMLPALLGPLLYGLFLGLK